MEKYFTFGGLTPTIHRYIVKNNAKIGHHFSTMLSIWNGDIHYPGKTRQC
jgi:hypothetical protein